MTSNHPHPYPASVTAFEVRRQIGQDRVTAEDFLWVELPSKDMFRCRPRREVLDIETYYFIHHRPGGYRVLTYKGHYVRTLDPREEDDYLHLRRCSQG